ncbi:MAG: PAS domain-containing sensor histidine kinase, partial [Lentisphaeria bacterium]|nr:PAS domain-containing sensor histidine kinase [Lentisphaeria bacterium]
ANPAASLLRQELEICYPERRIVQVYALPLEESDGQYVVILNDMTSTIDKMSSSAENERSRQISMLAAGVAHEIGNPLNSLYLHLQYLQRLMERDEIDREGALEELIESRNEVERLDGIITQFLHALRPGKPEFHPVDLKNLVLELLNFMRHEITAKEVNVEFSFGEDIPLVEGDAGQLKQALYKLVRNALQSMPNGGSLAIRCSVNEDFVSLSVTDSGAGIVRKDLGRIFEAYFTTKQTGTGLGLMIVERIVREHGGALSVDGGGNDGHAGATFTISLPRHDRRAKVLPAPEDVKE